MSGNYSSDKALKFNKKRVKKDLLIKYRIDCYALLNSYVHQDLHTIL
jgi:hypothetical protein